MEAFENIMNAVSSNNKEEARALYNQLTEKEKKQFIDWFDVAYYYEAQDSDDAMYVSELLSLLS